MAVLLSLHGWVDVRAYHGYSPGSWNLTCTHTHTCGYGSDRRMSEGYPRVLVARLGVVGVVGVFKESGSHQVHGWGDGDGFEALEVSGIRWRHQWHILGDGDGFEAMWTWLRRREHVRGVRNVSEASVTHLGRWGRTRSDGDMAEAMGTCWRCQWCIQGVGYAFGQWGCIGDIEEALVTCLGDGDTFEVLKMRWRRWEHVGGVGDVFGAMGTLDVMLVHGEPRAVLTLGWLHNLLHPPPCDWIHP